MKAKLQKVAASIAAAFTTPGAIAAEKSLAAIVTTRLLLSLGASAALIDLIVQAIQKA